MEEDGSNNRSVCVTGGSGYVASWLIFKLLQKGYKVHTTVRSSPERKKDISYLTDLPGASERLRVYNADLENPTSFKPAIEGCDRVFHLCNPNDFGNKEITEEEIIKKSINGSLGILQSCVDSKTVKRVVYTSSTASVLYQPGTDSKMTIDESSWSDIDYIRSLNWFASEYSIAKMLTEKACLEFAEKHGLDLVTVLPTWITGPFLTPNLPGSVRYSMASVFGGEWNFSSIRFVHVDDVARAQIFLSEYPDAKGRYICSAHDIQTDKLIEFLSSKYPEYHKPSLDSSKKNIERIEVPMVSSKKLLEIGFKYKYSLEEMYDDAFRCGKEKGLF